MSVIWENLDEFEAWMNDIDENIESAAIFASNDVLNEVMLPAAQGYVAVDTGALKGSLRTEPAHYEGGDIVFSLLAGGGGFTNPRTGREVDYPAHQEYGTFKMRPHPYMRPAMLDGVVALPAAFEEQFKEVFA